MKISDYVAKGTSALDWMGKLIETSEDRIVFPNGYMVYITADALNAPYDVTVCDYINISIPSDHKDKYIPCKTESEVCDILNIVEHLDSILPDGIEYSDDYDDYYNHYESDEDGNVYWIDDEEDKITCEDTKGTYNEYAQYFDSF